MKRYFLILVMLCFAALWGCKKDDSENPSKSIPRNEIHYTSTDGNIVELYSEDEASMYPFGEGVSIVSNVYENGKGIITCDGKITVIGSDAFFRCYNLTSITIPDSVTAIGYSAFFRCYNLTSITIPDSVTFIGEYAFEDCTSLTSITIPAGVTDIGQYAFAGCESLTSITIPQGVTIIREGLFHRCTNLTSITIPDSVSIIYYYAFYDCYKLTSIYCKSDTPPMLNDDISYHTTIYVPEKSVNSYKTSKYWSRYADRIVGYNFEK